MSNDKYERIAADVVEALASAMSRDFDRAGDVLARVGAEYGDAGMYGMCCAFAAAVEKVAYPAFDPEAGFAYIETLDGRPPEAHEGVRAQADLFAARFLTASLNRDAATRTALYFAPIDAGDDEQVVSNVVALLWMSASVILQVQRSAS